MPTIVRFTIPFRIYLSAKSAIMLKPSVSFVLQGIVMDAKFITEEPLELPDLPDNQRFVSSASAIEFTLRDQNPARDALADMVNESGHAELVRLLVRAADRAVLAISVDFQQ